MSETSPEGLSRQLFFYVVAFSVAFVVAIGLTMYFMPATAGQASVAPASAVSAAAPH